MVTFCTSFAFCYAEVLLWSLFSSSSLCLLSRSTWDSSENQLVFDTSLYFFRRWFYERRFNVISTKTKNMLKSFLFPQRHTVLFMQTHLSFKENFTSRRLIKLDGCLFFVGGWFLSGMTVWCWWKGREKFCYISGFLQRQQTNGLIIEARRVWARCHFGTFYKYHRQIKSYLFIFNNSMKFPYLTSCCVWKSNVKSAAAAGKEAGLNKKYSFFSGQWGESWSF